MERINRWDSIRGLPDPTTYVSTEYIKLQINKEGFVEKLVLLKKK